MPTLLSLLSLGAALLYGTGPLPLPFVRRRQSQWLTAGLVVLALWSAAQPA